MQEIIDKLEGHVPELVFSQIIDVVTDFEINSVLRLSHFLSQCSHESGGFKTTRENLNYSADGLKKTFPKYFPGNLADSYARKPEKIASRVYADRMGNGNEESKEGYKFRGRGYIQLTGKNNYKSFGDSIDVEICNSPDLVSDKYPLLSAAWYFNTNGLHKLADAGATDAVVTKITKRINGGTIGLSERIKLFNQFYKILK